MTDKMEEILDYAHDRLDADARRDFETELARSAELRADLAVVQAVRKEAVAEEAEGALQDAGWTALSRAIDADQRKVPANDNRRFSVLQVAAIAAIAVLASQIISAPFLMNRSGPGIVPASSEADALTLQVAFAEDARVGEVASLLREVGATLVDGPSAIGLIILSFPDDEARTAAQEKLAAQTDLVMLVSEP